MGGSGLREERALATRLIALGRGAHGKGCSTSYGWAASSAPVSSPPVSSDPKYCDAREPYVCILEPYVCTLARVGSYSYALAASSPYSLPVALTDSIVSAELRRRRSELCVRRCPIMPSWSRRLSARSSALAVSAAGGSETLGTYRDGVHAKMLRSEGRICIAERVRGREGKATLSE